MFGEIFKLIFYIVLFMALMLFTFYGTKFIAGNLQKINKSKYVTILDRIKVSENLDITLVEINDEVHIIASGNGSIEQIDKIDKADFNYFKLNEYDEVESQNNKMLEFINKLIGKEKR